MQQETWPSSLLAWEQNSQFPVRKGKGQAKLCFSSLFLLCLMVFRSCGVRGVCSALFGFYPRYRTVKSTLFEYAVPNCEHFILYSWKFQFLETIEGLYCSVVYLGQGSLNSVLHAKAEGKQTWTHMVSTVLAVSLTPADYIILLLGIHLRIHKVSVCFCSELVCTPWRQKQFF